MKVIGFMTPGPLEVILVLLVILLLFGARRLPELARSLGKSLNEFKRGREEGDKPRSAGPGQRRARHQSELLM